MDNKNLVQFLNQLLSNYYVMHVKLHRYHWYIQGRHFFQLHAKFEEMYDMFAEDLDVIAERILMIEGRPLASMKKYLKETTLTEATAEDEEGEMITQLLCDLRQMTHEIKAKGVPLSEAQQDIVTTDMLTDLSSKLEKYIWMFRAYLAKEDSQESSIGEINEEETNYRNSRTDSGGENQTQH